MRVPMLAVLVATGGLVGCLGDDGIFSDSSRNEPSSAMGVEEEERLTWKNDTHEGFLVGVEVAEENVNVGPASENTRIGFDVEEATKRLVIDVSSTYGIEIHIAPPDCDHGRFSDCVHEEATRRTDVRWEMTEPERGSWELEIHTEPTFTSQPLTAEIALGSSNASG